MPKVNAISLAVVVAACGFWAYCEAHFAKASDVTTMQEEIHQIYGKLIPQSERVSR